MLYEMLISDIALIEPQVNFARIAYLRIQCKDGSSWYTSGPLKSDGRYYLAEFKPSTVKVTVL